MCCRLVVEKKGQGRFGRDIGLDDLRQIWVIGWKAGKGCGCKHDILDLSEGLIWLIFEKEDVIVNAMKMGVKNIYRWLRGEDNVNVNVMGTGNRGKG